MTTPARRQYLRIKKKHPNEILLFQMGDFYETFDDDAQLVSRELEIALTSREMGNRHRIPLAGIPCHALESYLVRLIRKGYRVAICDQTSDPAVSRGLVDREVVRVVTPGTVVEESILQKNANNYLVSAFVEGENAGVAYVDITTGEFAASQFHVSKLSVELDRLDPSEILTSQDQIELSVDNGIMVTLIDPGVFDFEWGTELLLKHFGVVSLEAYGCDQFPLAVRSAGAIVEYLGRNHKVALSQLTSLRTYSVSSFMVLDSQTRRNLDLFEGARSSNSKTSLLSVLDHTCTPMGGRLLKKWLGQPLLNLEEIYRRQEAVTWANSSALRRSSLASLLKSVSDLERLVSRVRGLTATPRDLLGLAQSLRVAPLLRNVMNEGSDAFQVKWLVDEIGDHEEVVQLVGDSIEDDPPLSVGDGRVIRKEFSTDLDALRESSSDAQEYIAGLESKERERTGIKSLKVGYNKVFGYYIEVSNSNLDRVPEEYVRRQTLVGGERYITPEMKEYETLILNAQERVAELEVLLFRQVCSQVAGVASSIVSTAITIAQLDVFFSLGDVAAKHSYVRPNMTDGDLLEIKQGRHAVVERMLPPGEFVPNDVCLSRSDEQLIVLTGPNMAGKSTFIRQVAIITLMAQIGSFVPADEADIGVVDRIFTRVGLQDDLSVGQSTFMVEMVETASILNHATPKSLVIIDEIGRGTSTYDGLAIARAVAEHIHSHPRLGCKTLFATHYHELTQLAEFLPRVRNYNVAVSEQRGEVVFLRRIVSGGADKSYGVHVARIAGLPPSVINRAWEVLGDLEAGIVVGSQGFDNSQRSMSRDLQVRQLPFMDKSLALLEDLLSVDISSITPLEAINKLYEIQEQVRKSGEI